MCIYVFVSLWAYLFMRIRVYVCMCTPLQKELPKDMITAARDGDIACMATGLATARCHIDATNNV